MQLYPLKNLNIFTRTIHYRLGRKKGVCNGTASTKNKINVDQEVILLFKCTCIYYNLVLIEPSIYVYKRIDL